MSPVPKLFSVTHPSFKMRNFLTCTGGGLLLLLLYFSASLFLILRFACFSHVSKKTTERQVLKLLYTFSNSPLSQAFLEAIFVAPSCNFFSCAFLFPALLRLLKRHILVFFSHFLLSSQHLGQWVILGDVGSPFPFSSHT